MAGLGGGSTTNMWTGMPSSGQYNAGDQQQIMNAQNMPAGYEWDPMTQSYGRTPSSVGQRVGQEQTGQVQAGPLSGMFGTQGTTPSLKGLINTASPSGVGNPIAGNPPMGTTGGGPMTPPGGGPGGGGTTQNSGSYVAPVQMPDTSAATSAAFARAKDQAGALSRASLDSLTGELGSQGMLGGGAQAQGAADILGQATNTMGNEISSEAGQQAGIAADFAKTGYEGDITQRGQDIQEQEAAAQRNQNVLLALMKGINGGSTGTPATAGNPAQPY